MVRSSLSFFKVYGLLRVRIGRLFEATGARLVRLKEISVLTDSTILVEVDRFFF
jgi:hypothetical protein